jgi:hypothetical protein
MGIQQRPAELRNAGFHSLERKSANPVLSWLDDHKGIQEFVLLVKIEESLKFLVDGILHRRQHP